MKLAVALLRSLVGATVLASVIAWPGTTRAQVTPTPSRRDTVAQREQPDKPQRPDSVQHRIGRDNVMPSLEIGKPYVFDRDELFQSGALTLGDLLARIPGFSTFTTGWISAPQVAAYGGDFSRVRVFLDGIEMDDLEQRNGAAPDLHEFPIWALERVSLLRSANGLRIDMRSWEYNLTKPYTRVDVLTGDLSTNLYRAFYGKRYYNGAGLQIAAQQYGVTDTRVGGGGDQISVLGRYGFARENWSLDATAIRTRSTRSMTDRYGVGQNLPGYRDVNTLGYIRGAIGKEGSGPFLQLVASTQILKEYSTNYDSATAFQYGFPADTADTLASSVQYVATAGFDRWGGRLRLVERYRRRLGHGYNSPSATFDLDTRVLGLSALVERDEYAGLTRVEAGGRLTPVPFLSVAGFVGQRTAFGDPAPGFVRQPSSRSARLEGGLKPFSHGPWITAGVVTRDTALLVPPMVFDTSFSEVRVGRQTGTTVGLRGDLPFGFSVDATGIRWQHPGPYTPEYEAHGNLRFYTQWLSRFPNGNFSFLIQPSLDYRSTVLFPSASIFGDRYTLDAPTYSVLVELRILRGVITYQRRNLTGLIYDQVAGYLMPRAVNVYGVRWYFFN